MTRYVALVADERRRHPTSLIAMAPDEPDVEPRKAWRKGYGPPPFFFDQVNASGKVRLVAWTAELSQLRKAVHQLLAELPEQVEILLKITIEEVQSTGQTDSAQSWSRYYGIVSRRLLEAAIAECDAFVFRDSRNQLCVRDPDTSEYVVIDEYGLLFVYSDDRRFRQALENAGFDERVASLIDEMGLWQYVPPEGPAQQARFVALLGLEQVAAENEPLSD